VGISAKGLVGIVGRRNFMKAKNNTVKLLNPNSFFSANKIIARLTSNDAAILLAELIYRRDFYEAYGQLTEDDAFYATSADLVVACNMTRKPFTAAVNKLKAKNIIMTEVMGLPAKTYYVVDNEELEALITNAEVPLMLPKTEKTSLQPNRFTRLSQRNKLECPNGTNLDGLMEQTNNKKLYNKKEVIKNKKMTNQTNQEDALISGGGDEGAVMDARSLGLGVKSEGKVKSDEVKGKGKSKGKRHEVIDVTGTGFGDKDKFAGLPGRLKSGKVKVVADELMTEDLFFINLVNGYDAGNLGSYDVAGVRLLEDGVFRIIEGESGAVEDFYDMLCLGLGKTGVWRGTSSDFELIKKIEGYSLSDGDIVSKIVENMDKMLRGKLRLRFGQLFIGLDAMDKALCEVI